MSKLHRVGNLSCVFLWNDILGSTVRGHDGLELNFEEFQHLMSEEKELYLQRREWRTTEIRGKPEKISNQEKSSFKDRNKHYIQVN